MRSRSTFDLVATGLLLGSAALFTSAFSSRLQAQPANPAQARPVQARTYPGTPSNVQLDPPAAVSTSSAGGHWDCAARKAGEPVAQIAILLDTSSSMDGLIHQARTQVWRIVNELGRASYKGQRPQVQVALYEYGKSTLAREQGYVRCIAPFTTDLDRLSENLFALRTCGGEEYCGWVIRDALRDLDWAAQRPGNLRMVLIAGNEPFSQGPVDYHGSCRDAADKGVVINTIFCGDAQEGSQTGWAEGAALARGSYLTISQDERVVYRPAPQDDEIRQLNEKLNQTYVPYTAKGAARYSAQAAQDRMVAAEGAGGSAEAGIQRAVAKTSSSTYSNASWDLVDAARSGVKLKDVKEEDLPQELRSMPAEKRDAWVQSRRAEREQLQRRIVELNRQRESFQASQPAPKESSLAASVLKAVHAEGSRAGFSFGK